MDRFDDSLSSLCGKEMASARKAKDGERIAGMIQSLTSILGRTIAMATNGEPVATDTLLTGAENLMREEAAGFAPFAALAAARAAAKEG